MVTQELTTITKETQKTVLKTICEYPTFSVEELGVFLKNSGKNISQEEVLQVLHTISPNINWHRATKEDIQKEILDYLWTLEAQILFLFPTKQKETTIAEFNQIRLQNKQPKVQKDIARHLQHLLHIENKNLVKFRKFEKELSFQNDIDATTQASWAIRILLINLPIESVNTHQDLANLLSFEFKEKFAILSEKIGKTLQRICEKFVEKYFPKNLSEIELRDLIKFYQSTFQNYKKGIEIERVSQTGIEDQNKIIQHVTKELKEIQEVLNESEQSNSIISKLFTNKIKGKEGLISKIDHVIKQFEQINELTIKNNKSISEKALLVQKLQSDYENILFIKSQLENDLHTLKEKMHGFEEKNSIAEKELQYKTESIEKAHEKIANLQQKVEEIPEAQSKINMLREELSAAKDISLRLYSRINKIKSDLLRQNHEKPKTHKINSSQNQAITQENPTKEHLSQNNQTVN